MAVCLIRPSGTEPLLRVMVEAASKEMAGNAAERIAAVLAPHLIPQCGKIRRCHNLVIARTYCPLTF